MGGAEPFVVLCWENILGHIPPFRISPRQVTIGVHQPYKFNVTVCTEMPQIMVPAGVTISISRCVRLVSWTSPI